MPWCPKCKNEFQEGYTICSDCKEELVDELLEVQEYIDFFQSENKKVVDKLAKYFEYSKLKSKVQYNEELEAYILAVPSDKKKQAQKLYQAFYFVEREIHEKIISANGQETTPASEESDSISQEDVAIAEAADTEAEDLNAMTDITDTEADDLSTLTETTDAEADDLNAMPEEDTADPSSYALKSERYKDYAATVSVFLVVGILGIIFVILNIAGLFTVLNGILPNVVMGALFISFIIIAISSNKKAKELQLEIDEENKVISSINEWLEANVTKDYLASLNDDTITEELNYIRKTETIKVKLKQLYPGQNGALLDRLIEEYYSKKFDTQEV